MNRSFKKIIPLESLPNTLLPFLISESIFRTPWEKIPKNAISLLECANCGLYSKHLIDLLVILNLQLLGLHVPLALILAKTLKQHN